MTEKDWEITIRDHCTDARIVQHTGVFCKGNSTTGFCNFLSCKKVGVKNGV